MRVIRKIVKEDFDIPGTNIRLEKGDRISIIPKRSENKTGPNLDRQKESRGEPVRTSFGPGIYFLGDICYAMEDSYYDQVWGNKHGYENGVFDAGPAKFAVAGTAYGDGEYYGGGHKFGVDAGVLGVVPQALFGKEETKEFPMPAPGQILDIKYELGIIVNVEKELDFFSDGEGQFTFRVDGKTIDIDTSGTEEEEDEWEDEEDEWDDNAEEAGDDY